MCFWRGSELENWTTEFVQRTTNLEKQSTGLRRSEGHQQMGSKCDCTSQLAWTALGEKGIEMTSWGGCGGVGSSQSPPSLSKCGFNSQLHTFN